MIFTRKRWPTDHALMERTHQTVVAQARAGQGWSGAEHWWRGLAERRAGLNTVLPTRALLNQAPLRADPEARRTDRPSRPEREAELLELDRVAADFAQGRWFRPVRDGVFHLGAQRYYSGRQVDRPTLALRCDPPRHSFVCPPEGVSEPMVVPAQGRTKADLMGELAELAHLPPYQLARPWEREAVRRNAVLRWSGTPS